MSPAPASTTTGLWLHGGSPHTQRAYRAQIGRYFGLSRWRVRDVCRNPWAQQAAIVLLRREGFLQFG